MYETSLVQYLDRSAGGRHGPRRRRPPRLARSPVSTSLRTTARCAPRTISSATRWANGCKDVDIPSDRSSWGAFNIAQDNVEQQIRTIIEQADQGNRKIGDFYASFIDEKRRNELGLAPLKTELARVAALRDKKAIAAQVAHFNRIGVGAPIDMAVHQDNKASTVYIVDIGQSGLGMPNRDYYLADDAKLADTRAKYQAHVAAMLALAGHKDAAAEAAQIVALETAHRQGAVERRREPRPGQGLQQAQYRAVEGADAGLRLERLPEGNRRRRQGRLADRQPAKLPGRPRQDRAGHAAGGVEIVLRIPPRQRVRAVPVAAVRRREFRLPRQGAVGRAGQPPGAEARGRRSQSRPRRSRRPGLRQAVLPGRAQAAGRDDGEELPCRVQGGHRNARLDDRRHQEAGADQAVEDQRQGRLPGQVARLLGAVDRAR